MIDTQILKADAPQAIPRALQVLGDGGVVALPTDTVYGIGVLASLGASVEKLYAIKGRDSTKAIPVLIGDMADLEAVAPQPNPLALALAEAFWPGPLTLVLRRRPELTPQLSEGDTIGVRVPDHPVARALLRAAGPMGVTSANLSGGADTHSAGEVLAQLRGRIDLVLDGGRTPGSVPSTVVDVGGEAPVILRSGPITEAQVSAILA